MDKLPEKGVFIYKDEFLSVGCPECENIHTCISGVPEINIKEGKVNILTIEHKTVIYHSN